MFNKSNQNNLFKVNVLDHGHVEMIDYGIDEESIANIAGISYDKESSLSLIPKLLRLEHMSPFEMCTFIFKIKCPIFVDRHIVRHRTASRNEMSMRYVAPDQIDVYEPDLLKGRTNTYSYVDHYRELIKEGIPKELARTVLPLSTYVKYYWKIDLRNLIHFLKLRLSEKTQKETREYAKAILKLLGRTHPITADFIEKNY